MAFTPDMPFVFLANASSAASVMQGFITPAIATLCGLASLAAVFFLVMGGIQYMTSAGNPDKLDSAKRTIKNALLGLVLVLAAATLTAILTHAYSSAGGLSHEKFPTLDPIKPKTGGISLGEALINAVVGLLQNIVQSVGEPFLKALDFFLKGTSLMGENASVFNLWLTVLGIADVLFILVVALVGFQVMSFSSFGLGEVELKQLLPQFVFIFILMNTSIFAIDGIIALSNAMISAVQSGYHDPSIWEQLNLIIAASSGSMGVAGLLIMTVFLILSVMLLVYYVLRLVTLYIGAVLSPLVLLLWLVPAFKDFAVIAFKTYLTTIFVLFVHVVILLLASSLFAGMYTGDMKGLENNLMVLIVGLATVVALLKTQGFMQQLSYAASAPRAARQLSGSFMRGVSYMTNSAKSSKKMVSSTASTIEKMRRRGSSDDSSSSGGGKGPSKQSSGSRQSPAGQTSFKTGETRKAPAKQEQRP